MTFPRLFPSSLSTLRAFGKVAFYEHLVSVARKCCCLRHEGSNEGCRDSVCKMPLAKCTYSVFHIRLLVSHSFHSCSDRHFDGCGHSDPALGAPIVTLRTL